LVDLLLHFPDRWIIFVCLSCSLLLTGCVQINLPGWHPSAVAHLAASPPRRAVHNLQMPRKQVLVRCMSLFKFCCAHLYVGATHRLNIFCLIVVVRVFLFLGKRRKSAKRSAKKAAPKKRRSRRRRRHVLCVGWYMVPRMFMCCRFPCVF